MYHNQPPPGRGPFKPNYSQKKTQQSKLKLGPNEIAVITALLTNALTVESILINKDKKIEVLLGGSLQQPSELDKIVDEIRDVPVGDFITSLLNKK